MILDRLENAASYIQLGPQISAALRYLAATDFSHVEPGRYPLDGDRLFAMVQRNKTKPAGEAVYEAHRRYIDVQYVVQGVERMGYAPLRADTPVHTAYDAEKDFALYNAVGTLFDVPPGAFTVFFPHDMHAPGLAGGNPPTPGEVLKVVVKCLIAGR